MEKQRAIVSMIGGPEIDETHIRYHVVAGLPRVPWGHRMLIIDKCHSQPEKALSYVRRTIQNGWSRDVLRRRRSAICRDSVQVEERQGGEMTDCLYSAPCSYFLIYHQEFREQLIAEC